MRDLLILAEYKRIHDKNYKDKYSMNKIFKNFESNIIDFKNLDLVVKDDEYRNN